MNTCAGVAAVLGGLGVLLVGACSGVRVQVVAVEQLPEEVRPGVSSFEGYQLEGGAWVAGRPILVNRDFDFGAAMGVEDIGPAIAAAKRISGNQEVAGKLSRMPAVDLNGAFLQLVEGCGRGCRGLDGRRIRLFGLLYGEGEARLQVVLEIGATLHEKASRFVFVSAARPLEGAGSWLAGDGKAVQESADRSVDALLRLVLRFGRQLVLASGATGQEEEGCPVGGGEQARGQALGRADGRLILRHKTMPATILSCEEIPRK